MNRTNKLSTLYILLFSFILLRCANQLPPTGGEVDRIPPDIIYVYPADGTTRFEDDYFEIEFSEYVEKRSVKEAIFISPYIEGSLEYEWSGTTVEVSFPGGLKDDVTYTITIGTDVVDRNNGNRMAQSFSFSFSTGDKIDRKIISGKVYGKEREGIYLYAYKTAGETDSLLFHKPDYITQSGQNGDFTLRGLASGTYRVFAVDDKFKDLIYQQDQDEIGIPYRDVILNDTDSIFSNLNFLLFNADTTRPRLIGGVMTDKYHILVTFNKEVDTGMLSANRFLLIDSTSSEHFAVKYLFKGKTKPEELILVIDEELNPDNEIYLQADSLIDLLKNVSLNDYTQIIVSDRADTSALKVISTDPVQNGEVDFHKPVIKIYFDDAFRKSSIQSAVSFTDTLTNPVQFITGYDDDATLIISAVNDLKPEKDYLVKLDMKEFTDAAGNRKDTAFTLKFRTISGLDFTGLSGRIAATDTDGIDFNSNPVIVIESPERKELIRKQKLSSEEFEFTRIEPGKYLLWCFYDKNNSNEFDFGYPNPLQYSEQFFFYPDTIELKPRWEITDLKFYLK